MNRASRLGFWVLLLVVSTTSALQAQRVYRVDTRSQWQTWTFPGDLIDIRADGSVVPMEFKQPANIALNATLFSHSLREGGEGHGGVWKAGSGRSTAHNIIDGDPETFWRPGQADPLDGWWVEINLGRVMPVTSVRLSFPDKDGARPLREFRVFGADGKREPPNRDIYRFNLIGGTTRWNEETVVEFESSSPARRGVFQLTEGAGPGNLGDDDQGQGDAGGPNAVRAPGLDLGVAASPGSEQSGFERVQEFRVDFAPIQFIRILVDAKSEDAALAEVEVLAFGQNIALGTVERGGEIIDERSRGGEMGDGDVNTPWGVHNFQATGIGGTDFVWDLGAVFWVNRVIMLADRTSTERSGAGINDHRMLGSDGSLAPSGARDFELLFDFQGRDWVQPDVLTYLFSPPRPIRLLSGVWATTATGLISEFMVYPIGFVARVEMTSDFVQIDNRAQILQKLSWDAELPPSTRVQAQTRSGSELTERLVYYRSNGNEVSKANFDKLPSVAKGRIDTLIEPGEDWSAWSPVYRFSGQGFLSPSPRRFVQFRVILSSDRPEVAPRLRALVLDHTRAFISGVTGAVEPREAALGVAQRFTYHVVPEFTVGDSGFDLIRLIMPSQADRDSLSIRLDGVEVEPLEVQITPDSLVVQLPRTVRGEQIELDFRASVVDNPFLFVASVGRTQQAGLWQGVVSADRFASTVLLPEVSASMRLINNLAIQPGVLTPNGDGVGDRADIRFSVPKLNKPATVQIYALDGRLIQQREAQRGVDGLWGYAWSGVDLNGRVVAPGIYLVRVSLDAGAGEENRARTIAVAY